MAKLIEVNTISDHRGHLSIIEDVLDFPVKRVFYMYGVSSKESRGGHAHIKTKMALICLGGSCSIHIFKGDDKTSFLLDDPRKCLILNPSDWHTMDSFSSTATLLVLASEKFDKEDYISERL